MRLDGDVAMQVAGRGAGVAELSFAGGDFGEGELDLRFEVEAALRSRAARGAAATAAEAAEDVVEHREDVRDVHVGEVVRSLHARVAELVVAAALLIVGEDLVG